MEGELTSILPGEQKKIEAVLIQASIHPVAIQEFKKNPGEWESFLRLLPEEIQKGIEPIKIFVITPEIKERYLKAIARNIYDRLGGYQSNEIVKINSSLPLNDAEESKLNGLIKKFQGNLEIDPGDMSEERRKIFRELSRFQTEEGLALAVYKPQFQNHEPNRKEIRNSLPTGKVLEAYSDILDSGSNGFGGGPDLQVPQPGDAFNFYADGRVTLARATEYTQGNKRIKGEIVLWQHLFSQREVEAYTRIMRNVKIEKVKVIYGELPHSVALNKEQVIKNLLEDIFLDLQSGKGLKVLSRRFEHQTPLRYHPESGRGHNLLSMLEISKKNSEEREIRFVLGPLTGTLLASPDSFPGFLAALRKQKAVGDLAEAKIKNKSETAVQTPFWTKADEHVLVTMKHDFSGFTGVIKNLKIENAPVILFRIEDGKVKIKSGGERTVTIPIPENSFAGVGLAAGEKAFRLFFREEAYKILTAQFREQGFMLPGIELNE